MKISLYNTIMSNTTNEKNIIEKTLLRIGSVPEHFNLPWRLAISSGTLDTNELRTEWTDFPSGTGEMVRALNADEVDIAILLSEGAIKASANENCEYELVSFYTKTPLVWGVHVPTDSNLRTIDDLKSAKVAISRFGSGSHLMAFLFADANGWNTEALEFEIINNLSGARDLFKEGGKHIFLWEKFMTKPYVDNGEFRHLTDFPTPWPCFVVCVRKNILAKYKKEINIMLQTVLDIAQDLKASPIANKLIAANYGLKLEDVDTWLACGL